jgi:hypothetical protein
MAADDPQPPIEIHSVMINEAAVEISYAEEDDANRNTGIMKIRTIMIPRALVLEEMAELVEAATAVVDAGLVADRSPASTFTRRR